MSRLSSYSYEDLVRCAHAELFGIGNARLPRNEMLMIDRITCINEDGGPFGLGEIVAELDIRPDLWFFDCHFADDPVMPGCLGLDALWQMTGFFLGWKGFPGRGRALGVDEVRFRGEILPTSKNVRYHVEVKKIIKGRLTMGIGDGKVYVDNELVYTAMGLRVGLFTKGVGLGK